MWLLIFKVTSTLPVSWMAGEALKALLSSKVLKWIIAVQIQQTCLLNK